MDYNVKEVAQRLRGLREDSEINIEQVCTSIGIEKDKYIRIENGEEDFSVSFIYKCAELFNVDLIEILTGDNPKLKRYCIVRKGKGLPIERREGFSYQHIAYMFKNKEIEPLIVVAPYNEEEQKKPITLSAHDGQEFDYVIDGTMKMVIGDKVEVLSAGDAVYYDSTTPHGMIATDGKECKFLAILIKK